MLVWPGALRLGRGAVDDADALITWARDTAASLGLDVALIVIDTVARNMVGDENSTEDMGEFVRAIDRVWNELGCFVLTVHHSGKDVARGLRGSSALGGASDANILVQRDKEKGLTEPGEIILEDLRHAEDGKKYGFLLEYHKLGVDEDLEDVGSLVAVPHAPPKPKVRVGKLEQAIMDTLIDVTSGDPDTLVDEKTIYDQLAVGIDNGDFEDLKKPKSNHFRDALRRLKEKALIEKQEEKWKIV